MLPSLEAQTEPRDQELGLEEGADKAPEAFLTRLTINTSFVALSFDFNHVPLTFNSCSEAGKLLMPALMATVLKTK